MRRQTKNNYAYGFTLIELLVVISIVSLISAVVLASLNTSRERARIAAGMLAESNLAHSLGATAAVIYNLEEGSGTTIADSSGSGNNATITGAGATWNSSDTYKSTSQYSLNFSGTDYFSPSRALGIKNTNFTISLWIKTTSNLGQMYVVANAGGGDGFRFGLSNGRIAFLIGNGTGAGLYTESQCGTKTANDGKWHHIVGVFDRTNTTFSCYIDGAIVGTVSFTSYFTDMTDTGTRIGRGVCCQNFVGQLDNVRIYAENLKGVSIKELYTHEKFAFEE